MIPRRESDRGIVLLEVHMRFKPLNFSCPCDGKVSLTALVITNDRQIIIFGQCLTCYRAVKIFASLGLLFKMSRDMNKPQLALTEQSDESFMKEMKIRYDTELPEQPDSGQPN